MQHSIYSLIMAGGSGTRFWPRSRDKKPKQFLTVFENETLIQSTINRFLSIIPMDNIYIIFKQLQKEEILRQNLTINSDIMFYESVGKNTLPCIGFASWKRPIIYMWCEAASIGMIWADGNRFMS